MKKFVLFTTLLLSACYKPEAIVFHSTAYGAKHAMQTYEDYDVSVHYIIEENGNVISVTPDDEFASHAGASYWRGYDRMNPSAIGIEVLEPSLGQNKYSKAQLQSITTLSKKLIEKYSINTKMIVGHSDVSPTRKPDPGIAFPWEELSYENIGLWYYLPDAKKVDETCVNKMLAEIGYDISEPAAAQYAFARRYVPELVTKHKDVKFVVNNPYPKGFDASNNKKFVKILKAVYYRYSQPQYCI